MNMRSDIAKITLTLLLFLFSVAVSAGTTFTYYVNDALGSPVVAMDQAGDVIWRKTYEPYGKASGQDGDNRIGYTGHVEDQPDLVYAGARYYDPTLGRFLSDDPVRFSEKSPMSFNRYAYANNNPYKFVDPDGRMPIPLILLGVGALLATNNAQAPTAATDIQPNMDLQTTEAVSAIAGASGIAKAVLKQIEKSTTKVIIDEARTDHIFRDAEGHVEDTLANRDILEKTANNPKTTYRTDEHGNERSREILSDGTQAWTTVRDGKIVNGGINKTPK